jgi:molecular chaperone DnaK
LKPRKRLRDAFEAENKIPADIKRQVEQAISELKQTLTSEVAQSIRQATERLQQAASRIGEALSRAAAQGAGGQSGASGASGGSSGDDVVDAEFEEVDPRDKKAS